jgi:hypothetical protein
MAMVMPEHCQVEMIELTPLFMPYRIRLDDMGRENMRQSHAVEAVPVTQNRT